MNLQEFRALTADEQRTVLADMKNQAAAKIKNGLDEFFQHAEYERTLVPSITFKKPTPPTRVEVSPPTGDPEEAARDFFRRFPETKSIRIGSVFYERG